jgi:hypothetical protein
VDLPKRSLDDFVGLVIIIIYYLKVNFTISHAFEEARVKSFIDLSSDAVIRVWSLFI